MCDTYTTGSFQTLEKLIDKVTMISFAFFLCSTLLISGVITAPYSDATEEIINFANENHDLAEIADADISAA